MSGSWQVHPLAVVRPAGFSTGLVERLAVPELLELADRERGARDRLDRAAAQFAAARRELPRPDDPDTLRTLRAVARAVQKRRVLPEHGTQIPGLAPGFARSWNETCAARDASGAALRTGYPAALEQARAQLGRQLRDPRIREALVLLTPEILATAVAALLNHPPAAAAPNQNERKVVAFLQRLATKCETNGFAGPIAYATLGAALCWVPDMPARRGFVAYRAVRALLDRALERLEPGTLQWRTGPAAGLLAPGSPARRAATAVAAGRTSAVSAATLRSLHHKGVVWARDLLAPVGEPDALRALAAAAEALPGTELAAIAAELTRTAAEFAAADADGKTAALATATAALAAHGVDVERRGRGELYADRVVLYEEDHDPGYAVRLPAAAVDRLFGRLEPVLDLAAAAGLEAWRSAREQFAAQFAGHFGAAPVSLTDVLTRLPTSVAVPLADTAVATRFRALVAARWDGAAAGVVLDPGELRDLLPALDEPPAPLLLAPDLHFATTDRAEVEAGRAPVVVGEIHGGLQGLGNLCCFVADRAALARATRDWLGGEELVHVATGTRFGKLCYLELLPRTLELSGPAAPGQHRLRPDELDVYPDATVLQRDTGRRVVLLLGDAAAAAQSPLGPPGCALPTVTLGHRSPRISVGDVVLQRASWRLPAGDLHPPEGATGAARYRWAVDALRARGVPRRCFAAIEGERKPMYVDLAGPHLVELLLACSRQRAVRITEMLPTPEDTWQQQATGPHLCEVRFSVCRGGGTAHPPQQDEPRVETR